jgi:hypothetical protein
LEGTSVLWDSLAHNAYGIYLVHYFFVNWLQYLFLQAANPRINPQLGRDRSATKDSRGRQAHLLHQCGQLRPHEPRTNTVASQE